MPGVRSMPHDLQLLGRWLEANNASYKQFPWNAIAVNYNFPYGRQSLHRDRNNEGCSVSLAFGMSHGGRLVSEDMKSL